MGGEHDQIILAALAIISMMAASLVYLIRTSSNAKTAAQQSTAANKAVNDTTFGEHRLYDKVTHLDEKVSKLVATQEEFATHGWGNLPPDIGNAVNLTGTIRELQHAHVDIERKIDSILAELREHVEWEMKEKYGKHGHHT